MSATLMVTGGVLLLLLALSAFFSGSETAIFSLNHLERDRLRREKRGRFPRRVLDQPEEVLVTILIGNMVVNLVFASLIDGVVARYVGETAWLYAILISTILLLIFGEMTPKNIAIRHSVSFFSVATPLLSYMHTVLTPIRVVLELVQRRVVAFLSGGFREGLEDRHTMITSTLQAGLQMGLVHPSELAAAESFLEFRDKTAEDVMIPRTALEGIDVNDGLEAATAMARREGGRSPVLVYEGDIDHLRGYFTIKDLLAQKYGLEGEKPAGATIRPLHPVPESKNLLDLMREMISLETELALVVDEYGGTAGVLPFRALVEDFLQFFYTSERPSPEQDPKVNGSHGLYQLPGDYRLEDLEDLLGETIQAESYTVAGLIMERVDDIPEPGYVISLGSYEIEVRKVSESKILEVEVRKT